MTTASGKVTATNLRERDRVLLKPTEAGLLPAILKGDAIVGRLIDWLSEGRMIRLTFRITSVQVPDYAPTCVMVVAAHPTFWAFWDLTTSARSRAYRNTEAWLRLEETKIRTVTGVIHSRLRQLGREETIEIVPDELADLSDDPEILAMMGRPVEDRLPTIAAYYAEEPDVTPAERELQTALLAANDPEPSDLGMCLWFAMCEQPATHREPHPIFGSVPACDRCPTIGR